MADRRVKVIFSAEIQNWKAGMAEAEASVKKTKKASEDAGKAQEAAGKQSAEASKIAAESATKHADALENVGSVAMAAGALTLAGVGLAVKSYADFDKQMSSVSAATHDTAGNMQLLRDAAVSAGADTAFSAVEAAKGIEQLSKAGVSTKDILGGGLAGALSLAAAGELAVGDAAEIAATAMTQFKLSGDKIPHVADLLAAGAGKAQGSVHDLGMALNQSGLVASAAGVSIEETTGTLAAFASAGLVGSDAGTSFKSMLQRLQNPSKEAAGELEKLGISMYDTNDQFVGMSNLAGQLQTEMARLTQAERDKAMATIFGSDAVRASNVLYEQGTKGIEEWTDKVNDAGYAAETAALMQDNLAGDLEKLGGAFDTALIKSGSGANDVLRGLVQGLEDVVDSVGKIPTPVLNAGLGVAALAGGALLLGGSLITVIPKIAATKVALELLVPAGGKAATALALVGKAALPAAAALTAVMIVKNIAENMLPAAKSTQEMTSAMIALGNGSKTVNEALDKSVFARANNGLFGLGDLTEQIDTAGGAIARLNDLSDSDRFGDWMNENIVDLGGKLPELRKSLEGVDTALGDLTGSGNAELAAKSFKKIAEEAEKKGVSLDKTAKSFPQYIDSLKKLADESKVTLTEQELLDWAMGKIPAKMEAAAKTTEGQAKAAEVAAKASEDLAKALEAVGLSADGSVTDIGKFAAALFSAGLLSLSASDASVAYQAAIDDMTASVLKNGTTLDLNTEAGRANQSTYNGLARSAMSLAEATATETLATQGSAAAQAQLQESLRTSYTDLINAAGQLGITGDAADTMARKALGIPKEIPIETWVNDKASATLDGIKGKADNLDGRTISFNVVEQYTKFISEKRNPTEADLNGDTFRPGNSLRVPGLTQATGGRLPGYADGGQLPTSGPGTDRTDGFLGIDSAGIPRARVDAGEWIIKRSSSDRYNRELAAINAGTFPKMPGYANGGRAREYSARDLGYAPSGASSSTAGVSVDLSGATYQSMDPGALRQEILSDIKWELQKQGVRLGG